MKPFAIAAILLLVAMPVMAKSNSMPATFKKATTLSDASKAIDGPRKFGAPRRIRGERYFEQPKTSDFSGKSYTKGTMTGMRIVEKKADAKDALQPKKKPEPFTFGKKLTPSASFTKNTMVKR